MGRMSRLATETLRRAPQIVLGNLAIAIAVTWIGIVPSFLTYALAAATALGALNAGVMRAWAVDWSSKEQLGFRRNRDMILYDMIGRGYPEHALGLSFACFLSALLTAMRPPGIFLVAASALLAGIWSTANRKWPRDKEASAPPADPGG